MADLNLRKIATDMSVIRAKTDQKIPEVMEHLLRLGEEGCEILTELLWTWQKEGNENQKMIALLAEIGYDTCLGSYVDGALNPDLENSDS